MLDLPFVPLLVAAWLSAFVPLAGWLASRRDRSIGMWAFFGAVIGPVAAVLLVLAPPGHCPTCGQPTRGWLRSCTACGSSLIGGRAGETTAEEATRIPATASATPATATEPAAEPADRTRPATVTLAERTRRGRVETNGSRRAPVGRNDRTAAISPGAGSGSELEAGTTRPATALGRRPDDVPAGVGALPETSEAIAQSPDEATRPATRPRRGRAAAGHEEEAPPAPELVPVPAEDAPAPRKRATRATVTMLGSGVYIGGNRPLQPGSRYLVARVGTEFQAFGPVHLNPSTLADRVSRADVEAVIVDRRLLVSSRDGRSPISMVFQALDIEPGIDLEMALRSRSRQPVAPT
jgi:hypothetical protein